MNRSWNVEIKWREPGFYDASRGDRVSQYQIYAQNIIEAIRKAIVRHHRRQGRHREIVTSCSLVAELD